MIAALGPHVVAGQGAQVFVDDRNQRLVASALPARDSLRSCVMGRSGHIGFPDLSKISGPM